MFKKLALLTISTLVLGGCTLKQQAATDELPLATVTPTPTVMPSASPNVGTDDAKFEESQKTSDKTDNTSLESDINSTVILEEDFSDLN